MKTTSTLLRERGDRWPLLLACPLFALAVASAAGAAPAAKPTYHLVPLSDDRLAAGIGINASGQVAFNELFEEPAPGVVRARFYDGRTISTLGTFGGNNSRAFALNKSGQLTGYADAVFGNDPFNQLHGFRWSKGAGLIDLSRPPLRSSFGADINDKGEVVGSAVFDPAIDVFHAARWSARNLAQDLGTLGGGRSAATATNEAGTVVGWSDGLPGGPVPFRWTQAGGMQALGTFGSEEASASDVNASGAIVGTVPFRQGGPGHAFLWSPRTGLIDLGTGAGLASGATRINDKGMAIGFISKPPASGTGFVWTWETGLIAIGRLNLNASTADGLNSHGQVVGGIDGRAYSWTRAGGIVDLNSRICHAPKGLVLRQAYAINDNGAIVAATNTGLVLLSTQAVSNLRPLVGPIGITGTPRAGATLSFAAYFTDADTRQTHTAVWHFGEGEHQPGIVNERQGKGNVSGQHTYEASGEYAVRLTVTDSSGKSTTVRHDLIVP